jgi:hypothetical protein
VKPFVEKLFAALLWAVLLGFVGYLAYQHYHNLPCQNQIEYKIGALDPRFGVSQSTFLADIQQASSLWSNAEGKKLFEYNPQGSLTINLVYDDHQKITQQEDALTTNIDQNKQVADSVKQQFTSLRDQYNAAQAQYQADLAAFNQAQTDYTRQVTYWNEKGGAPPKEYAALQEQKNALSTQRASLEDERLKVNGLAEQVNALIDKYNLLVSHINTTVDAINNDGLTGTEFEEGVYISDDAGERINIYQFNSKTYFIRVLAHELGHSLGLGHNNGPDSIMNPVNQSKSLALSAQDIASLQAECGM